MPEPARHRARGRALPARPGRHHRVPDERLRMIAALVWAFAVAVLAFDAYAQAVTSW